MRIFARSRLPIEVSWRQFARELPLVLFLFSIMAALLTWEPEAMVLAGLMLATLVIVAVLKPLLRHRRPVGSKHQAQSLGVGFMDRGDRYGMPSGHSAMAFAFFTYALIWLVRRKHVHGAETWQRVLGYAISVPVFVVAPLLVAFQRIHDRHHSLAQVIAGASLGAGLGVAASLLGK
jgi:membrane-associated phospholipid phosphatase